MKVLLFSIGTRGDVEPFLAVAEILKERGCEVVCVFPEQFREEVESLGYRFYGFSREFLDLLLNPDAQEVLGGGGSFLRRAKSWYKLARAGMKISNASVDLQHEVLTNELPDRVLYHPKCLFVLLWSMANPGRAIMMSPIPGVAHPVDDMSPMFGDNGRSLNRLAFRFMTTAKILAIKNFAKRYRKEYPQVDMSMASFRRAMLETERAIYTVSPTLFPKPPYWPDHVQVVGYFERDKATNWEPSDELLAFLKSHEQVVLISFGSMTNPEPQRKSEMIVNVLRKLGQTAIVNTSWGGLQKVDDAPDHVLFVESVPYDWLFPRIAAVVHHGGSGTTHMGVKYGLPSLIIPHAVDQFFWDRTIARLGLGPRGVRVSKLTESNFEERLADLLANEEYARNAQEASEQMRSEADPDRLFDFISN